MRVIREVSIYVMSSSVLTHFRCSQFAKIISNVAFSVSARMQAKQRALVSDTCSNRRVSVKGGFFSCPRNVRYPSSTSRTASYSSRQAIRTEQEIQGLAEGRLTDAVTANNDGVTREKDFAFGNAAEVRELEAAYPHALSPVGLIGAGRLPYPTAERVMAVAASQDVDSRSATGNAPRSAAPRVARPRAGRARCFAPAPPR